MVMLLGFECVTLIECVPCSLTILFPFPFLFLFLFRCALVLRPGRGDSLLPRYHSSTPRWQQYSTPQPTARTHHPSPYDHSRAAPIHGHPAQDWRQPLLTSRPPIVPPTKPTVHDSRRLTPFAVPAPPVGASHHTNYQACYAPSVRPTVPGPSQSRVQILPRPPAWSAPAATAPSHPPKAKPREIQAIPAPIIATEESAEVLRRRAWEAGERKRSLIKAAKLARRNGNKKAAAELARGIQEHENEQQRLNQIACKKIFEENSKRCSANTIDLHGLYVPEAVEYTNTRLLQATRGGDTIFRIIVGKGLHSKAEAQLKPAVMEALRKKGVEHELAPKNDGVVLVYPIGKARVSS
ncbi:hypothetical protein BOTBODRAFT_213311 [Botryobasidium botryosum FD-172 SS1]|uniref:Smr domain-containing protein n=1 Tax=Botryobasidium botryosum (strain FD-172 SS1) TaxID=930990 RepID=A0A067N1Q9_BOTB1|nr:hypothetical protein BOTBODRAFT_213311 [Botryobasidium botryosum FD-172 SS1]